MCQSLIVERIVFVELFDEIGMYGFHLLVLQILERDGEIDSRLNCDVKRSDSICCEDENAIVILKYAQ